MSVVKYFLPGFWLPLHELAKRARAEGAEVTERWDLPLDVKVPPDLNDVDGRYFRLRNGGRVSGRMLPEDAQIGFQSAAVPFLFALLPVLTLVTLVGQALLGVAGVVLPILAMAFLIAMISTAAGTWSAIVATVVGIVLPLAGPHAGGLLGPVSSILMTALMYGVPALVVAAIFVNKPKIRMAAKLAVAIALLSIIVLFLPPVFHSLFWVALGCALTPAYAIWIFRVWALRLAKQGIEATLESTGPQVQAHVPARRAQALAAAKDSSVFVEFGKATGIFSGKMDGFAPDPGMPFGISAEGLSTHLVVHGASGSGKTSSVLHPLAKAFLESGYGGALILDGKASLASEFTHLPNYLLIEPGVCDLALIQDMTPEDVVVAFDQVNQSSAKSESGNAAFFRIGARTMLHHVCVFLRAICDVENAVFGEKSVERRWRWTISDVSALMTHAQRGSKASEEIMKNLVAMVNSDHPNSDVEGVLSGSIRWLTVDLQGMDKETRANIFQNVSGWLNPVMHHSKLEPWSRIEYGVDPTDCLRGRAVGVCLPAMEFGQGAALIQALIKQRVFVGLRKRGRNKQWSKQGETPCMVMVDEAHELCGSADLDMLPVARSLGGMCVYATQHIENWVSKFGDENAAKGFLGHFRSAITFTSSPATLAWMRERLGTTWSLVYQTRGFGVDYKSCWKMLAESPLADRDHPAHAYYRTLLRRGAGVFRDAGRHHDGVVHHDSAAGMSSEDRALTMPAVRGGSWTMQPLFLDAEADYLAEKFVACAEVMRGGVRRRDIIRLPDPFVTAKSEHDAEPPVVQANPVPVDVDVADDVEQEGDGAAGAMRHRPHHSFGEISEPEVATPDVKVGVKV